MSPATSPKRPKLPTPSAPPPTTRPFRSVPKLLMPLPILPKRPTPSAPLVTNSFAPLKRLPNPLLAAPEAPGKGAKAPAKANGLALPFATS